MKEHRGRLTKDGIRIYEKSDFAGMHAAGSLTARILDEIAAHVYPGQTTGEIDRRINDMVDSAGAKSATIGYKGYAHASCISVNHVVCHGIPGDKRLKDGDILNIDVTVIVDGWFGDSSRMYVAGKLPRRAERLIQVTHDALFKGIEAVRPGKTFGDIGHAIQAYVEAHRMSVVRDFCGHGLGQVFHAPPNVLHYGRPGTGAMLEEGMFFTIEPMVNLGRPETKTLADDWTAVTRDKSLSAQFE
ncbi:MAG: type I methionyl aminopeptidase, partial [Pseudomonadota bacterium]